MTFIDTSIAVDHLRGRPEASSLLRQLATENEVVAASEVVRFELLAGVRENEVEALETFFKTINWVPVGESITRAAAALFRKFRAAHGGIDLADYLIAATALLLETPLLTTNVRHYPMFAGLEPPY